MAYDVRVTYNKLLKDYNTITYFLNIYSILLSRIEETFTTIWFFSSLKLKTKYIFKIQL